MDMADKIIIPIAMGCVATFLIFWSLSGLLIKIFTSIKSVLQGREQLCVKTVLQQD